MQSRKRTKKTAAPKANAPKGSANSGNALKQRDRMLSQVKAYQRLRPEDRRALLTDKVCCYATPSMLLISCRQVERHCLSQWYRLTRLCAKADESHAGPGQGVSAPEARRPQGAAH